MINLQSPTPFLASVTVFVASAIWGLYWLPLRMIEALGISATWTTLAVNFPAFVVLAALVMLGAPRHRQHMGIAAVIGVAMGFTLAFFTMGIVIGSVVRVTLLFYMVPIWGTLLGWLLLGERSGWGRWIAIVMGLVGMGFLVSGKPGGAALGLGDLFGLLSGISWAIGGVLIKRYNHVSELAVGLWQFAFGSAIALGLGWAIGLAALPASGALISALGIGTVIAVVMIVPAMVAIFWAQRFLFPGRVGVLMMAEVLVAVISAAILLPEEWLTPIEWVGALLIIAACFTEALDQPKKAQETP